MMNQDDLSYFTNAVMRVVEDEFKRQDIWLGSPLRMSVQRDLAQQCWFFMLSKLNWEMVVKIAIDETLVRETPLAQLVTIVAEQAMAALLLNGKESGVRRVHP